MSRGYRRSVVSLGVLCVLAIVLACPGICGEGNPPARPKAPLNEAYLADTGPGRAASVPGLDDVLCRIVAEHARGNARGVREQAEASDVWTDGSMVEVVLVPEKNGDSSTISKAGIAKLGGVVTARSRSLMQVRLPVAALAHAPNKIAGVRYVRPPMHPIECAAVAEVDSEAVQRTAADAWHAAEVTGSGAKVAVIDGGFAGLSAAISNGDIPASAITRDETGTGMEAGTSKHGTANAEGVCDVAPDALLYLIKIDNEIQLENAKDYCISQGVHIINHSLGWFGESDFDGTGLYCDIANDADSHGILWINAAGNHALQHYQGAFVDSGSSINYMRNGTSYTKPCHRFPVQDFGSMIYVSYALPGDIVRCQLTWDAWQETNQDYDLFLYSYGLKAIIDRSRNDQTAGAPPCETIAYPVTSAGWYAFLVTKFSASRNHRLNLIVGDDPLMIEDAPNRVPAGSCTDPSVSPNVMAVGAIDQASYTIGPQEDFSSQGPTNGGITKPDICGPDNCSSYTYGVWWGTSQSAPFAAGAAALVKSAFPAYTNAQIRSFLEGRAMDMGPSGKDNVYGSGRLALGAPPSTPTVFPVSSTQCPAVSTECPASSTSCPVLDTQCPLTPASTVCPYVDTQCPASPQTTVCPVAATSCPEAGTQCPETQTACPVVATLCPTADTACPSSETSCPTQATHCPAVATQCPAVSTECPASSTTCPIVDTQCPATPQATVCPTSSTACPIVGTQCPTAQTACPVVSTLCPATETQCPATPESTVCPTSSTACPVSVTQCPPVLPTQCPVSSTSCPVVDTQCPLNPVSTVCPYVATQCPATPQTTVCPTAATSCPEVSTQCPTSSTSCPPSATACPVVLTQCPTASTSCPVVSTSCPLISTECPVTATVCPAASCMAQVTVVFEVADQTTGSSVLTDDPMVNVTTFTATPSEGSVITGYMITETDEQPDAGGPGWLASIPSAYTIQGPPGQISLYGWARDSAGQVGGKLATILYSPVVSTVLPVSPTVCPPAETQCPPLVTQCPASSTSCPAVNTSCPQISTECPSTATACPSVSTSCPAVQTSCPVATTSCPATETQCPVTPQSTVCPALATECPVAATQCPPSQTYCPTQVTNCPAVPTQCPAVATECPASNTTCPVVDTQCPANLVATVCPTLQTQCPAVATQCPPPATHSLTVHSTPIAGIPITGDKPGTTNYTATCNDGQMVNLTAPPMATVGGTAYGFVRWTVDGAEQFSNNRAIQVPMDADHTAVAVYAAGVVSVTNYSWLQLPPNSVTASVGSTSGVIQNGYDEPSCFRWGDDVWMPSAAMTAWGAADYWAQIQLDTARTVKTVRVQSWAAEGCRLSRFTIEGSTNGSTWTEIGSKSYSPADTGGRTVADVDVTDGTYLAVRVKIRSGDYMCGSAMRGGPGFLVIEPAGDGTLAPGLVNWANGPNCGTSVTNANMTWFNGLRYNDGWLFDDDTVRTGAAAVPWPTDAYAQVALPQPRQINKMIVVWDFCWVAETFDIKYSTDGMQWQQAPQLQAPVLYRGATERSFATVEARFWRVTDTAGGTGYCLLNQVLLFGPDTATSRTLTVHSTPITGIPITGDKPGTTGYTALCELGSTVVLSAPLTVTLDGVAWGFVRWTIDGVDQPDSQASVQITMDADHTVAAIYEQSRILTVQSICITGVPITGDKPGITNYTAACDNQEVVSLTAPPFVTVSNIEYVFVCWAVDGQGQPRRETTVRVTMDEPHTATAKYAMPFDTNEDGAINILDLIFIRNKLGERCP